MLNKRPSLKKDEQKLTAMQKRFVEAYTTAGRDDDGNPKGAGFNATKAAILAGYSPRTAYSIAHELRKKPHIQKAIKERMKQIFWG